MCGEIGFTEVPARGQTPARHDEKMSLSYRFLSISFVDEYGQKSVWRLGCTRFVEQVSRLKWKKRLQTFWFAVVLNECQRMARRQLIEENRERRKMDNVHNKLMLEAVESRMTDKDRISIRELVDGYMQVLAPHPQFSVSDRIVAGRAFGTVPRSPIICGSSLNLLLLVLVSSARSLIRRW